MDPIRYLPSCVGELKAEWDKVEQADERRRCLAHQSFNLIEQAERNRTHLQDEVERLLKHERHDHTEIKELQQANKRLQERLDTASFVLVLIDDDNTLFHDDFVKAGLNGGHDAAHLLQRHIKMYFQASCNLQHHWHIVVRIFANITGLVKAYHDAGVVSDPMIVRKFLVGFNREFPLYEFIDAGGDKEAADKKIQENFKLYHAIEHCKHVMLASSGDRGYVTFLRPYSAQTTGMSLLKSLPFPPDFKALSEHFAVKEFREVFKGNKLVSRAREQPEEASGQVTYAAATVSSPLNSTWATTNQPDRSSIASMHGATEAGPPKKLWVNKHNQRLDEPLKWNPDRLKELIAEKLCVKFFLASCEKSEVGCTHKHNYKGANALRDSDKQVLLRIGRLRPCFGGLNCEDKDCLFGHECTYGSRCTYRADCRFGQEMHNVEKEGRHLV